MAIKTHIGCGGKFVAISGRVVTKGKIKKKTMVMITEACNKCGKRRTVKG